MRFSPTKLLHGLLLTSLLLAACGGGGGGSSGGGVVVTPPVAPTGVSAVAGGSTQIHISWTLAAGATSYKIYRSTTPGVTLTSPIATVTTSPYTNTGLSPLTPYYYKVTAVNAGGESAGSDEKTATTLATPSIIQRGGSIQGSSLILSTAVTTLAGTADTPTTTGTGDGVGTAATFKTPTGTTTDGTNLYVVDTGRHTIRKIVIATGETTTVAGTAGTPTPSGTGDGNGTAATFNGPKGIVIDNTLTYLYVTDTTSHTIRQIAIGAPWTVTTVAGTAGTPTPSGTGDGNGTAATFNNPNGITTDGTNLYVTDTTSHTIRQIAIGAPWTVTTVAGTAGTPTPSGTGDGNGTAATFNNPNGITTDGTNLYVTDTTSHTIRQIAIGAPWTVTTVAGTAGTPTPSGTGDGNGTAATFKSPIGITCDGPNLYVADTGRYTIRKIVSGGSWTVTTVAGTAGTQTASTYSGDGTGTSASFNTPDGITTDGINLYVADFGKHTIRKIQ